tara:strand:- start:383 stop:667 length:285 start_codon:yes stop_codon:yes gene_type:complete
MANINFAGTVIRRSTLERFNGIATHTSAEVFVLDDTEGHIVSFKLSGNPAPDAPAPGVRVTGSGKVKRERPSKFVGHEGLTILVLNGATNFTVA